MDSRLNQVKNFLILYSFLEKKYGTNTKKVVIRDRIIKQYNNLNIDEILSYFINLIKDDAILHETTYEYVVKQKFKTSSDVIGIMGIFNNDLPAQLLALILINDRIRNNLMHWLKYDLNWTTLVKDWLDVLIKQEETFKYCNDFMIQILS